MPIMNAAMLEQLAAQGLPTASAQAAAYINQAYNQATNIWLSQTTAATLSRDTLGSNTIKWYTPTTSTGTTSTWYNEYEQGWMTTVTPQEYYSRSQGRAVRYRALTAAERAAEAERERLREVERQRKAQEQQERNDRARALLLEHLTPEQRRTFEQNRWFIVRGGASRKRYRIETEATSHNIKELGRRDAVLASICCHVKSSAGVPHHDHHLAQKLSLEYNEEEFLRIANIYRR